MFTIMLLTALLGQHDYALCQAQVNDYAFAPLRAEQLVTIAPLKKRTAPTPAKCSGGVCAPNPQPPAREPQSVLIEADSECSACQPNQSATRRTVWRGRLFRSRR